VGCIRSSFTQGVIVDDLGKQAIGSDSDGKGVVPALSFQLIVGSARRTSKYSITGPNKPASVDSGYYVAGLCCSTPPLTPAHWRAGRPQSAIKPAAAASSKVLFGS
jgi:hypothetical protein